MQITCKRPSEPFPLASLDWVMCNFARNDEIRKIQEYQADDERLDTHLCNGYPWSFVWKSIQLPILMIFMVSLSLSRGRSWVVIPRPITSRETAGKVWLKTSKNTQPFFGFGKCIWISWDKKNGSEKGIKSRMAEHILRDILVGYDLIRIQWDTFPQAICIIFLYISCAETWQLFSWELITFW